MAMYINTGMLDNVYPLSSGTFANVSRLFDINKSATPLIWLINTRSKSSKLPNIKLKQVTIVPPNFCVDFFPQTP